MNITIGFGYDVNDNTSFVQEIKSISDRYGYGIEEGIESFESDAVDGIGNASQFLKWKYLISIRSPVESMSNLAYAVSADLDGMELNNSIPIFFKYSEELFSLIRRSFCKNFCIFFASEWNSSDLVRSSYGDLDQFLSLLKVPGHWQLRVFNPRTGRFQNSDQFPFLFEFVV